MRSGVSESKSKLKETLERSRRFERAERRFSRRQRIIKRIVGARGAEILGAAELTIRVLINDESPETLGCIHSFARARLAECE